jgi:hypothetical protein
MTIDCASRRGHGKLAMSCACARARVALPIVDLHFCRWILLFAVFVLFLGEVGLATLLFVSLCYRRYGEETCYVYAMAASGRMQYDYKQTNSTSKLIWLQFLSTTNPLDWSLSQLYLLHIYDLRGLLRSLLFFCFNHTVFTLLRV